MIEFPTALFNDMKTIENAIKDNLAIINPTAFNKMQLDELLYFHEIYKKEIERVCKGMTLVGEHTLTKDHETLAHYERHEQFKPKNRGL